VSLATCSISVVCSTKSRIILVYISLLSGVILLQLSVLVALATSSSLPAPIGASDGVPNYSEDLDEFTATTLETFGFCKPLDFVS